MASWNAKWSWVVALLAMLVQLHFFTGVSSRNIKNTLFRKATRSINDRNLWESPDVALNTERRRQVVMSNGLVEITLSSPDGEVIGIKYNGIDNVLETDNAQDNRGYWDVVWYKPGEKDNIDKLEGTNFQVIMADKDQVEISFTKKWNYSQYVPLNVDKRYIMRRGVSGFYAYAILEREPGWPDVDMDQIRAVFKLQKDRFHYMAISDERQRIMPMPEDRETGQPLAYPEAVLLTKPINTVLKGEVDDKYQYSSENKDNKVRGWISANPPVGFWMITPSDEFLSSGPTKQDLTAHVGPTVLSMFTSTHYGGKDIDTKYRNGEPWKKVLGPVLVYLNQVSSTNNIYGDLWRDAKAQMWKEVESWPYDFLQSQDFPKSYQRGNISGQLQVFDRCIHSRTTGAKYAYVGLAAPGQVGSWQTETKGYQFWTQTDEQGNFFLKNVREGDYDLYAWVPGFIGDYKHYTNIAVKAGSEFNLGAIVYRPPRNGPTLWEIGVPDRSAAEFFVPDPYPTLMNRLYSNEPTNKFRQYGLWARYADIYGNNDLKYTIGISDHSRDWFFAHVTRDTGNRTYQPTTRRIMFELLHVDSRGDYTLQVAMAAASESEFQLRINDANVDKPDFSTGLVGKDNAIARHGIHGLYRFYSINIPSNKLYKGSNTFYLTQSRSQTPFQGILYDYIRLEGPPSPQTSSSQNVVALPLR